MIPATDDSSAARSALNSDSNPSFVRTLGWAAFLGCSWTWCIGMFLPVLLVRDYGVWGWVVFAIPNVIGAAAMGWVIPSPEQSRSMVSAHWPALRWFSVVTVAFQIYFAGWFFGTSRPFGPYAFVIFFVTMFGLWFAAGWRNLVLFWAAVVVLAVSGGCFVFGWVGGLIPTLPPGHAVSAEVVPLAAVCFLGFLTCPYLDLTFHQARGELTTTTESRAAFAMGFGIFFLAMILFTLAYSGVARVGMTGVVAIVLLIHMAVQLGFTVAVHLRAHEPKIDFGWRTMIGIFIALPLAPLAWEPLTWHGVSIGEIIYRIFMGFYGLVFPAYVWLCMLGSSSTSPTRRGLSVFVVAVVLACPFYWMGFIEQRMVWLIPGLAIVLLARVAVGRPIRRTGEYMA